VGRRLHPGPAVLPLLPLWLIPPREMPSWGPVPAPPAPGLVLMFCLRPMCHGSEPQRSARVTVQHEPVRTPNVIVRESHWGPPWDRDQRRSLGTQSPLRPRQARMANVHPCVDRAAPDLAWAAPTWLTAGTMCNVSPGPPPSRMS
jgi:hypothetical protein